MSKKNWDSPQNLTALAVELSKSKLPYTGQIIFATALQRGKKIFKQQASLEKTMEYFYQSSGMAIYELITFGQTLQKGNVIGTHVLTINLDPDVTMNQFKAGLMNKWIPELEKQIPGMKVFLLNGNRGENNNRLGFLYIFESKEHRDKFWADDGATELGNAVLEKMNSVSTELEKLGTWSWKFTDWVIE